MKTAISSKRDHQYAQNNRANGSDIMQTWVDTSYATHYDIQGHTGGAMFMGQRILNGKLLNQKINTKSSTET